MPPGGIVPTSQVNSVNPWSGALSTIFLSERWGVFRRPIAFKSSSRNDTVTPEAVAVPIFSTVYATFDLLSTGASS